MRKHQNMSHVIGKIADYGETLTTYQFITMLTQQPISTNNVIQFQFAVSVMIFVCLSSD